MVENKDLDKVFRALADPSRRAFVAQLGRGARPISELEPASPMSLAAISKHVGVLESAGLLRRHKQGRQQICELNPSGLADSWQWLDFHLNFWNGALDRLEQHLDKKETP